MEQFKGFPSKMKFTAVPDFFLTRLLPQISDIYELKTTLHIFQILYHKRGYPRFTTHKELLGDKSLMSSLKGEDPPDKALRHALEMATKRGTIVHLELDKDSKLEDIYFLNTEAERQVITKIQNGELKLSGLQAREPAYVDAGEPPDIFSLYEQNIGMLTPMIADELRDAEQLYPQDWIRDAIKEAVALNKRSWRYIAKILENWSAEGKSDGTHRGDSKKTGPDKYLKQKYGHIVKR
jgi:DnaD/phage-associated family protein